MGGSGTGRAAMEPAFIQTLAHDLRQPLRRIILHAQRVQHAKGSDGPQLDQALDEILQAARAQEELIGAVVEYDIALEYGIETGTLIPLRMVIQSACDRLDEFRSMHQGIVELTGGALPETRIPAGVGKALEKVLHNALKFHAPGTPPRVYVDSDIDPGGDIAIRVTDDGVGIEPRFRQKVTNAFVRLHTAADYPGCGLGLAICQALLDSIGGSVAIDGAAHDSGVTVTLRFPAQFAPA